MKVALYGNVCNNFYAIAKCLRENNIADAHLYLNDKIDFQHRPESDDPKLKNNYPDWIHMDSKWDPFKFLKKFDKRFVRELNKYDIVFLSDFGLVLAPYIKAKTIFYVTGQDLTRLPFPNRLFEGIPGLKYWFIKKYVSFMQRKGIRSCTKIITQPFAPFTTALKALKVPENHVSKSYYPILMDVQSIKNDPNAFEKIDEINREKLQPFKFIIFHPSRIFIKKIPSYIASGHWKGNDNLIKGFGIFLKKYKIADVCLAMPERNVSPDIGIAKQIIGELGIENNIVWLKPPTNEGFPRNELMNYYSISNIVADEFATGWFGSIVIEGAACSKPVFCYVDEEIMKQLYPWHPIISAKEPEKIADEIAKLYFDKNLAKQQGEKSREWALKFHSFEAGARIYVDNLKNDLREVFN
ncbi:MAG TPA: glycosyltransferase [Chitinophagaceae bacterium]|nr:glycosyltransferase [Chitinophagaceae bacterium]